MRLTAEQRREENEPAEHREKESQKSAVPTHPTEEKETAKTCGDRVKARRCDREGEQKGPLKWQNWQRDAREREETARGTRKNPSKPNLFPPSQRDARYRGAGAATRGPPESCG